LQRAELDLSEVKRRITSFIRKNVEESQTDGVLLALDGGVGSAVAAHLCVEALGSRRVTGLIMPDLRISSEEEVSDAKMVASELCLETRLIDVATIQKSFMRSLESNKVAEENLRARIRMSLLYYHANLLNRLVAGSVDRSEILLGHFSKYGDGGVDILPLGGLYKTEVRKLGEVLGINRRIVAKRRAQRAWTSRSRLEIGVDYDKTDQILRLRLDRGLDAATISAMVRSNQTRVESVIARYEASLHKRDRPGICAIDRG
jgi:NAD+ synthase